MTEVLGFKKEGHLAFRITGNFEIVYFLPMLLLQLQLRFSANHELSVCDLS